MNNFILPSRKKHTQVHKPLMPEWRELPQMQNGASKENPDVENIILNKVTKRPRYSPYHWANSQSFFSGEVFTVPSCYKPKKICARTIYPMPKNLPRQQLYKYRIYKNLNMAIKYKSAQNMKKKKCAIYYTKSMQILKWL